MNLSLAKTAVKPEQGLSKELAFEFHALLACEEALEWGCFRSSPVGIGGTSHKPPAVADLNGIYEQGITAIKAITHPVERALVYYFWGAMNQFFYDVNKRTSRTVMNFILLTNGYYYLSVPAKCKAEFTSVMIDFYDSKNATRAMRFMLDCYRNHD